MLRGDCDPIYLDGFASLPIADEALSAIEQAFRIGGNAGSGHVAGERAARTVARGRASVAALIGAAPAEIIFTSGATEANNLALLGVAARAGQDRRRIIISAVEHKSVLEPAAALARNGFVVDHAPVDRHGRIDIEALEALLGDDVLIVSVMAANNETGVIQPIPEVGVLAHRVGALMHCDAAQAAGKIGIDVIDWDVDYLSLSAHKCYGPMGIGALYVAAGGLSPSPLLFGGGQQGYIRPGTEPVPLIAGFGAAADLACERLECDAEHGRAMIARLTDALHERQVRFAPITGDHEVLPGSLAARLTGVDGDALCMAVGRELCISTGSACTHGQVRPSHVLESMQFSEEEGREVVRLLCPRTIDCAAIDRAAGVIADAAYRLR